MRHIHADMGSTFPELQQRIDEALASGRIRKANPICPRCGGGDRGQPGAVPLGYVMLPCRTGWTSTGWVRRPYACGSWVDPWTREDQQVGSRIHCGAAFTRPACQTPDCREAPGCESKGHHRRPPMLWAADYRTQRDGARGIVLEAGYVRQLTYLELDDLCVALMSAIATFGQIGRLPDSWRHRGSSIQTGPELPRDDPEPEVEIDLPF